MPDPPAEPKPFNPLEKRNLAESIVEALEKADAQALPPSRFVGAGVYVLYYGGPFELYKRVGGSDKGWRVPIYVGKAVPPGGRVGGIEFGVNPGPALYNRLGQHARSIEEVENLELKDFRCRFLAVEDIWIPLGENLMISKYKPIWNTTVTGFGIHAPGKGRGGQQKSIWDTIHPGRALATGLPPRKLPAAELQSALKARRPMAGGEPEIE